MKGFVEKRLLAKRNLGCGVNVSLCTSAKLAF